MLFCALNNELVLRMLLLALDFCGGVIGTSRDASALARMLSTLTGLAGVPDSNWLASKALAQLLAELLSPVELAEEP